MNPRRFFTAAALAGALMPGATCLATFHFMQIEQVVGSVNGDTTLQAIQLRMRTAFQTALQSAQLWVRDSTGSNPVLLKAFATGVANGAGGDRVLIASAGFAAHLDASVTPDYLLDNLIPASYLPGGSLTFEDDFGTVLWRVSWGSYTGPTTGAITNDGNGDFGGPVPGPLPSSGLTALQFQGSFSALSTTNTSDYDETAGASTWTNNARVSGTLVDAGGSCTADVNSSGDVDVTDLLTLLALWGPCAAPCSADIDGSGVVDVIDLLQLLSEWGPCA